MKKLVLTSITAITIACPAIATTDIASNAQSANCTEPVLGTTSGESNLQAKWTANTLNLRWTAPDADNWSTQNGTCTYDAGITVPQTNPSRTGYTFAGWHVKAAANILASLNINTNGTYSYGRVWSTSGNNYICWISLENGGATGGPDNCSDPAFSDIALNEWKTEFSYGTVYGEASCQESIGADVLYLYHNISNVLAGTKDAQQALGEYAMLVGVEKATALGDILTQYSNGTITYEQADAILRRDFYSTTASLSTSSTGQYCWCKATNYTPLNGSKQSVAGSKWAFRAFYEIAANCSYECADNCARGVLNNAAFRSTVFGVSGE